MALDTVDFTPSAPSQSVSDPTSTSHQRHGDNSGLADGSSSEESCDKVDVTTLLALHCQLNTNLAGERHSYSTLEDSPPNSRSSSPGPCSVTSATTPSVYNLDSFANNFFDTLKHTPWLSRWRSSPSTRSASRSRPRPSVEPTDFRTPSEHPEKRFVDSIGIVCPGVTDRVQCDHPLAHFVFTFRICEPIEYTTVLADHGITYADYSRLLASLQNFMDDHVVEARRQGSHEKLPSITGNKPSASRSQEALVARHYFHGSALFDTTEQLGNARQQADALNQLLEDITSNLRARHCPVMVCVGSFSLFAPHRISEAHIQILHVPFTPQKRSSSTALDARRSQRLSFVNQSLLASSQPRSVSRSRPKLESRSQSDRLPCASSSRHHHQSSQSRDRSRPYALWPNAIPSRRRQEMCDNADRYGVDPYFRQWMRATINSRTRSSTYAKYMIEQEDDPFVNRRLGYTDSSSENRAKYEHNRKLECRRTIEHGSRLRLVRFGFRYTLYPPHTPEMEELGLTEEKYHDILSTIGDIQANAQLCTKYPMSYLLSSLNKIRHRSIEDALMKVSEYIRELNASQRRVVWTIEKIPGVYDRGLAKDRTEWEISAWNGEDPLELLLELERWGIIEQKLSIEDED
ncbi:hypothetical protein BDU57DRAFT_450408 [Ampelomyces quisqualis]|uniref:Uncharacterized protein n=1 Tax=Ampelomyces quisqualis TaxID=50730 RepID=A0A6A5QNJ5_AMPQU|nr:hypothetical protein BDU57DRAFT_450408 [Ampelomyces quisqualis]